ncbi:MAG: ketoacyl-ACP synthase III [Candidatus Riflebacteria bacterium]|nr:ketoacyl-ACP synthase III [Candidatus Riflebacteria bacterium]
MEVHVRAFIRAIEYHLPSTRLDNIELAREFGDWSAEKIFEKTGIRERRIAQPKECASDLGYQAAMNLFERAGVAPADIDFLLFCTQSPDFFLPTTACLLQERLKIPSSAGALDFNLGCSGFVYGLGLAKGLIESGQVRNVLLITAETYSKFIHRHDRSVRTLFGDGAAATLIEGKDGIQEEFLGPFIYGTDGNGGKNLIVPKGGFRNRDDASVELPTQVKKDEQDRNLDNLYMNGSEIFSFTLRAVPLAVTQLLKKASVKFEDIDLFVFHQANSFLLEHLRKKMGITSEKFMVFLENVGNTVSSTIPIALFEANLQKRIRPGSLVVLVGFGVGYSWGASLIKWQ